MPYTTTYINRNFLLKVSGTDGKNRRINKLVGVSGLVGLIGEDLTSKFVTRALNSRQDKVRCCLRRGLRVTLYFK
jgi:hypothetical protein